MRTIALFLLFVSAFGMCGCTSAIVRAACSANTSQKSREPRNYEVQITVATSKEEFTSSQLFQCTPSGYYCGGGEWHPNFPPVVHPGFRIQLPKGEVQIPLPACAALEETGTVWAPLSDWPISHLRIEGDNYVFSSGELQQSSSVGVAGVRVKSYLVRKVPALE